jgi:uncharacterized membrane protein
MQGDRFGDPWRQGARQEAGADALVLRINTAIGGVLTELVQQMADVMQKRSDDQFIAGAIGTGMMGALLGMFALADILTVVVIAATGVDFHYLVSKIRGGINIRRTDTVGRRSHQHLIS